jgi:hypothetical protein
MTVFGFRFSVFGKNKAVGEGLAVFREKIEMSLAAPGFSLRLPGPI